MNYLIRDLIERGLTLKQIRKYIDEILCRDGISMTAREVIKQYLYNNKG